MQQPRLIACLLVLAVAGLGLVACSPNIGETPPASAAEPPPSEPAADAPPFRLGPVVAGTAPPPSAYTAAQIERGRHLVEFGSCHDCHTPMAFSPELGMPVPDMSRSLSGHPEGAPDPAGTLGPHDAGVIGPTSTSFKLPFGTVYAMNLTPDVDTGTGTWTERMFLDIFRTGRHLGGGGRPILPPMPWLNVNTLSDEEIVAIFAYLRSLPPIRNHVPSPEVPEEVLWALRDGFDKVLAMQPPRGGSAVASR